jgi:succinate dehydrogenase/fumarate reductase-like Fe-S protein
MRSRSVTERAIETNILVVMIQEDITLEPLSKSRVIKDLVVGKATEDRE